MPTPIFDGSLEDRARAEAGEGASQVQVELRMTLAGPYTEDPLDPKYAIRLKQMKKSELKILRFCQTAFRDRGSDIIALKEIRELAHEKINASHTLTNIALRRAWQAGKIKRYYRGRWGMSMRKKWQGRGTVHGVGYQFH